MGSGKGKVCKWVFLLNVLSRYTWIGYILFTLVLTQVNSSSVSSTNSTVRDIFGQTLLPENEKNIHEESSPKVDVTEKVSDYAEQKSNPDSLGSQEFIFAEVLSQNSAVVNGGLAETGQPVLVTLVDTAAAELTNNAAELLDLDKGGHNYTDVDPEYDSAPVTLEVLSQLENSTAEALEAKAVGNESQENLKSPPIVKVTPKEKDDEKQMEKTRDETNNTDDSLIPSTIDNSTELEATKKLDVVAKPSEVQEEIPSFAEWAQKQLEEAEKNKENGVNYSAQSTQGTVSANVNLKVRSKNYASPDCGAKIVAANPESVSSGFILSPSRDEYMLNTCNSRIWFVVELCEAIQAKKVEMANFELFSSTPKNFSVFVSDRFPTREWASVGQFIAKDERDIQIFNLHPHLFGKFIKVELHSYYGSEHYCPISMFRAYGTSEFEVFETENSPQSQSNQAADDDDDDDEILEATPDKENIELSRNLFGSARDAVMSIMKKAAQVLVKSGDSKNSSENVQIAPRDTKKCKTPSHIIVCDNCSNSLFTDVFDLMSCKSDILNDLIESPLIHNALCNTDMCQQYGLDFKSKRTSSLKTEITSYISALLMPSYVAALCNMLAIVEKKVVLNTSYETDLNVTSNLTIDKKVQNVAETGKLNDLLQNPFAICEENTDHPSCKNKPIETFEQNNIVPSITSSMPSDLEDGDITDIKPTKTLQKDTDQVEASVVTVGSASEKTMSIKQTEKHYTDGQTIEASIINNVEQKATEILGKEESNNQIIESAKDLPADPAKSEEQDFGLVAPQEVDADSLNLDGMEEGNIKLSTQDQITLDNLLTELEQGQIDSATPSPQNNAAPTLAHQGQKESVFLRLSNRIKALERNMSLSGQYLEELSRRYKKQMEEMQKTFEKTLITMNEESKKAEERELKSSEEMIFLQQQIAQLSASVSLLLTDRDSFFGSASLLKVMLLQVILTVFVVYIFKRNNPPKPVPERNSSQLQMKESRENPKPRRRSTEEIISSLSGEPRQARRRRPSEEAVTITRKGSEMREIAAIKLEKKKRKRKSPIFQRSNSIAAPTETHLVNIVKELPQTPESEIWVRPDMNRSRVEIPIALDEAEFVSPELEPVDFSRMGEMKVPNINGVTPKKEFPKTNGSIFGKKTPDSDKSEKIRRLSSPAFFRASVNRHSSKSVASNPSVRGVSPIVETPTKIEPEEREVGSEERQVRAGTESPQLSNWSSIGDVSQASSSAPTDSAVKKKKSKAKSLKNIFKKVF